MVRPFLTSAALLLAAAPCLAQDPAVLAGRVEALQRDYVRQALELAGEYEKAGDPAGAIRLLERAKAAAPDAAGLDRQIASLREDVLSRGETTLQLDAPVAWTAVARVGAGRPYRLAAEGALRVRADAAITPAGLPPGDGRAGLLPEHPLGALLGTYLDPKKLKAGAARPRRGNRGGDEQEVFLIGAGGPDERRSEVDGVLFVRLNVPPNARVTGRVKLTLSGEIIPAPRK